MELYNGNREIANIPFDASCLRLEIGDLESVNLDFDHFRVFIDYNDENLLDKLYIDCSIYFSVEMTSNKVFLGIQAKDGEVTTLKVVFNPDEQADFLRGLAKYFYFCAVWGEPVNSSGEIGAVMR